MANLPYNIDVEGLKLFAQALHGAKPADGSVWESEFFRRKVNKIKIFSATAAFSSNFKEKGNTFM